jgi:hypothetical protein
MVPRVLHPIARAGRNHDLTWRLLFNMGPTLAYRVRSPALAGEAARVLGDLKRDGVARSTVSALPGDGASFTELSRRVERLEEELAGPIAAARAEALTRESIGEKTFIFDLLGEHPPFDPESVFARFALQPAILGLANAYFGMYTRLRYYNVWHTFVTQAPARESQLWHCDRDDHRILKAFLYLNDVDEGSGPFVYAPGTHRPGNLTREPAYAIEGNVRRTTDEQMASVVPQARWFRGVGPKGTIIFADTRGFHKGGLARERDRLLYTCMFTSQASQSPELMDRSAVPSVRPAARDHAFALASSR